MPFNIYHTVVHMWINISGQLRQVSRNIINRAFFNFLALFIIRTKHWHPPRKDLRYHASETEHFYINDWQIITSFMERSLVISQLIIYLTPLSVVHTTQRQIIRWLFYNILEIMFKKTVMA
jgi:hypothetical protein